MSSDYFYDENFEDEDDYFGPGSLFDYRIFRPKIKRVTTPYYKLRNKKDKSNMKSTDNLYFANYHINDAENYSKVLLDDYRKKTGAKVENTIQVTLFIHPNKTLFDFITVIKEKIGEPNITVNFVHSDLVQVYTDRIYFSINLVNNGNVSADVFVPNKEFGMDVLMYGDLEQVKAVYSSLRDQYILSKPIATWLFRDSDGSINGADFDLINPSPVYQEYYPFIDDVNSFGKRFMESSASVLVLYGPPGTGKTAFVRNMLVGLNEGCLTTFDDSIMQSDKLYIRFLNNYHKVLVMEDADTILLDREADDNKVMSKILSASDGLISVSSKKLIFTTNLTDLSKVDSALIRPGRCFDVINFRKLSQAEAEQATGKMGVDMPQEYKREYSLAELFNKQGGVVKEKSRVGFIR